MTVDNSDKLNEVFCEVLEKLAFMFAEPASNSALPCEVEKSVEASMSFTGAMQGKCLLMVPEALCPEIAANILGLDSDDELATLRAQDALKELLNVTCGRILTALAGTEPVFDLTVPVIMEGGAQEWKALLDRGRAVGFLVDDSPVLLELSIAGSQKN